MKQVRYVSGVQASGRLHIGNYFGAIRPQIERQDLGQCFFFVADYHSLTSVYGGSELRWNIENVVADYLALGLDPEKAVFFRQSDVPEVTELAWILSCATPMGLLERCHAYKDKTAKGLTANVGLFSYPILMAADILIYGANRVPVGKDQIQHLEVTRDIAGFFNHRYGNILVLPEAEVDPATAIIPGTDGEKMSKSHGNAISIFAWDKEIEKSIMGIVTDTKTVADRKNPEGNTVYELYRLMASKSESETMAERFRAGGYGYGEAKKTLLSKWKEYFGPFRQKREEIVAKGKEFTDRVLAGGAAKARAAAHETLERVRVATGLTWPDIRGGGT